MLLNTWNVEPLTLLMSTGWENSTQITWFTNTSLMVQVPGPEVLKAQPSEQEVKLKGPLKPPSSEPPQEPRVREAVRAAPARVEFSRIVMELSMGTVPRLGGPGWGSGRSGGTDPRVRVVRQEVVGLAGAKARQVNRGCRRGSGPTPGQGRRGEARAAKSAGLGESEASGGARAPCRSWLGARSRAEGVSASWTGGPVGLPMPTPRDTGVRPTPGSLGRDL